ncbi:MAG: hypothetical protein AAB229_06625 [Candidatus Hydrogenedentota bacterium]
MEPNVVFEDRYYEVIAPRSPYNCRDDGGHLILIKKVPVHDRSDLTWQEALDFMRISMAVGRAMYEVVGVERMNYEDLGNWGLDRPGGSVMHLHFIGRAKVQIHQIRGHHLAIMPQGHPIYSGHLKPFTTEDVLVLRARVADILQEEKYRRMAEMAEVD